MVLKPVSMLNQVGLVVFSTRGVGVGGPVDAAVVAREQDARGAGHEGQGVLVDVDRLGLAPA